MSGTPNACPLCGKDLQAWGVNHRHTLGPNRCLLENIVVTPTDVEEWNRILTAGESAKPIAWVRYRSDGGFEGPIMDSDSRMDGVRRTCGAWTPLYDQQAAVASKDAVTLSDAVQDVTAERVRQVTAEGWTLQDDDGHGDCEMALAAIVYAESAVGYHVECPDTWPWSPHWFKPTTPRRDLVKAGALILAEIERIDRAAQRDASKAEPALSDAAIKACALMIKGICMTRPQDVWTADIEARIRHMLATPSTDASGAEVKL